MTPAHQASGRSQSDIAAWLAHSIAGITGVRPQEVSPVVPFTRLGLDSAAAVALTGELEEWLGRRLDPTLLYDYTTIEALAGHLAQRSAAAGAQHV
jgi:acyl carrier protein